MLPYPVVAILPIQGHGTSWTVSYAVAKYFQNNGCTVVVAPRDETLIPAFLKSIHCLVVPGGSNHQTKSKTAKLARTYFEHIMASMPTLPVLGICMGFQIIVSYIAQQNWDALKTNVESIKTSLKLDRVSSAAPSKLLKGVDTKSTLYSFNNHEAILHEKFLAIHALLNFFDIKTTTTFRGHKYVSTIEGKAFPWFAVQWHPEKPGYEWSPNQNITRDPRTLRATNTILENFKNIVKTTSVIYKPVATYDIENYVTKITHDKTHEDSPLLCYFV